MVYAMRPPALDELGLVPALRQQAVGLRNRDGDPVAVDVSVPRPAPAAVSRAAAVPARLLLSGIVAASFLLRFVAALWHTTPLYFPDEYIYSGISRSLAESGKPLIRGSSAHFPAMLEPLLAAPFWLTHDPDLAYRLTQAENALAMSLAAVPVYLLVRRLGGGAWVALAGAALTVASPDLFFSSFLLADAIAYPLVLGAVYLGVCALAEPSPTPTAFSSRKTPIRNGESCLKSLTV